MNMKLKISRIIPVIVAIAASVLTIKPATANSPSRLEPRTVKEDGITCNSFWRRPTEQDTRNIIISGVDSYLTVRPTLGGTPTATQLVNGDQVTITSIYWCDDAFYRAESLQGNWFVVGTYTMEWSPSERDFVRKPQDSYYRFGVN